MSDNLSFNGFICVDKPLGKTSSDAVLFVRRRLPRGTAVGHGGTLDPEASGVLPVCVGGATRLFDFIIDKQKTYVAELQLGLTTDTQDATGNVISESNVNAAEEDIISVLPRFTGSIMQIPPMFSAIKRDGRRLYELARKGETIAVEPRQCRVDSIRLLSCTGENRYKIEICCGRGVYIRTLCHDIGAALGCGGHMASLRRTGAGIFNLDNAHTLDEIDALYKQNALTGALIPMDAPLTHLGTVRVYGERCRHAVKNGNPLKPEWIAQLIRGADEFVKVYLDDEFAGVGELCLDGMVKFRAMLLRT